MTAASIIGPIDRASMWITVGAETSVFEVEEVLRSTGLTLGAQPPSVLRQRVREWLEGPLAGRRVEGGRLASAVAGLEVVVRGGKTLETRATPRSAAGPALAQLFLGSGGRFGVIRAATLRAEPWPEKKETLCFQGEAAAAARWIEALTQGIAPPLEADWIGGPQAVVSLCFPVDGEAERLRLGEASSVARVLGLEPADAPLPWKENEPAERELARDDWIRALRETPPGRRLRLVRLARESAVFLCAPGEEARLPPPPARDEALDELESRLATLLSP